MSARRRAPSGVGSLVAWALCVVVCVAVACLSVACQFNVYKKKHGQHMTFWDFVIDAEVKR